MRLLISISVVALAMTAHASPFLVCDPQAGVTHYELAGPVWVPTEHPAQADGSIRMDVSGANVGNNAITVRACNELWGCSDAVPFEFPRPNLGNINFGFRIVP